LKWLAETQTFLATLLADGNSDEINDYLDSMQALINNLRSKTKTFSSPRGQNLSESVAAGRGYDKENSQFASNKAAKPHSLVELEKKLAAAVRNPSQIINTPIDILGNKRASHHQTNTNESSSYYRSPSIVMKDSSMALAKPTSISVQGAGGVVKSSAITKGPIEKALRVSQAKPCAQVRPPTGQQNNARPAIVLNSPTQNHLFQSVAVRSTNTASSTHAISQFTPLTGPLIPNSQQVNTFDK
jgi:hypothetical protein